MNTAYVFFVKCRGRHVDSANVAILRKIAVRDLMWTGDVVASSRHGSSLQPIHHYSFGIDHGDVFCRKGNYDSTMSPVTMKRHFSYCLPVWCVQTPIAKCQSTAFHELALIWCGMKYSEVHKAPERLLSSHPKSNFPISHFHSLCSSTVSKHAQYAAL